MNDPLYSEILARLISLNSESSVNELADLCHSVYLGNSAESLASLLRVASRIIHPAGSLFLLKFISAYAKKDQKFLKCITEDLSGIVLHVYQSCHPGEKETIRLYVSGWRMRVSPWPDAAVQAEGALILADNIASLQPLAKALSPVPELIQSLGGILQGGDKLESEALAKVVSQATDRLRVVISCINQIRNIVGT